MIHPAFADRVASRYVTIYQREGFKAAQEYLDAITKGNDELKSYLVPLIVDKGNNTPRRK